MPSRTTTRSPATRMAVKLAAWRRDVAEKELAEAVHAAREQRLSWREAGEAIGTSGEAAASATLTGPTTINLEVNSSQNRPLYKRRKPGETNQAFRCPEHSVHGDQVG